MIKTAIDTDKIGRYIGNQLYRISTHNNVTQTEIAKKLGVKPNGIGVYLTGKVTTKNLEQYWRIAEAIPLSRAEFDRIVEDAKRHVLGDLGANKVNDDPDIAYATLARHNGISTEDLKKAIDIYKTLKR